MFNQLLNNRRGRSGPSQLHASISLTIRPALTTLPSDWLQDEVRLAELLLAAKDMQITVKLIERIPPERAAQDLLLDAVGIAASYCRPFKPNNRKRAVGLEFLTILDGAERELHDNLIDVRAKDQVHSDLYPARVQLQSDCATVWVRDGAEPRSLRPEDFKVTLRLQTSARTRSLTQAEMNALNAVAKKLDRAFQVTAQGLIPIVIGRRTEQGQFGWFALGEEGPSSNPPAGTPKA